MKISANKLIQISLLYLLLIVLAVGTVWVFKDHTFRALSNEAMESAQIARNISEGRGFSTAVLPSPEASKTVPNAAFLPEMRRAPLYPFLLASALGIKGATDDAVIFFSSLLYVVSVVLLFALAQRVLRQTALAFGVAVVYLFSTTVLSAASSGYSQSLSAVLIMALLFVLTPPRERDEEIGETPAAVPPGSKFKLLGASNFAAVGALAGLCYLADYCSLFYLVPLIILWPGVKRGWNLTSLLTFAIGFAIICAPWWIRNVKLAGNPFYSAEWLVLTNGAGDATIPSNLRNGLNSFFYNAVTVPHLLLTPFIAMSFWIRPITQPLARRMMGVLIAVLVSIFGMCAFGRFSSADLVPLAGLLSLTGLVAFVQIVGTSWFANSISRKIAAPLRFEAVPGDPAVMQPTVTRAAKLWQFHEFKLKIMSLLRMPMLLRTVDGEERLYAGKFPLKTVFEARAVTILTLLLLVPLAIQIVLSPKAQPLKIAEAIKPVIAALDQLQPQTKKDDSKTAAPEFHGVVVTDIPQALAWYGARTAMALPGLPSQVSEMTEPKVAALYLTEAGARQNLPNWQPVYAGAKIPEGFLSAGAGAGSMLLIKQPSVKDVQNAGDKIENLKDSDPEKLKYLARLGQTQIEMRDLQKARRTYLQLQKLKPNQPIGFIGGGFVSLSLRDLEGARTQFTRGLRLAPRDTIALLGMAQIALAEKKNDEAIGYYERVLADEPNRPEALNNLASLYSEKGTNKYRALELARRVVLQDPKNGSKLDTLGWLCHQMGYRDEAIRHLRAAVKASPDNPTIVNHLKQAKATGAG